MKGSRFDVCKWPPGGTKRRQWMTSRLRTESGAGEGRVNWEAGRAIQAEESHEAKGSWHGVVMRNVREKGDLHWTEG